MTREYNVVLHPCSFMIQVKIWQNTHQFSVIPHIWGAVLEQQALVVLKIIGMEFFKVGFIPSFLKISNLKKSQIFNLA